MIHEYVNHAKLDFIYKNIKKKVELLNNIEKLLQSQTYHESYLHVTPTRKKQSN